ncbi:MAG: hypothetical protein Q9202_007627 [Teloschistes flavicans]
MSDSPSLRSSSTSLTSSSEFSHHRTYNDGFLLLEDREWYCKDGYHPVNLQDEFKNSRYRVIHKLGHGGYATVWLARDQMEGRYVALKINAVDVSPLNHEINILQHLATDPSEHPGKQHVVSLLDHFTHDGPNGTHSYISDCNILFKIKRFDSWTEEEVYSRLGKPKTERMTLWGGGSPGSEAPREVIAALDMASIDPQYLMDEIVVNDLGAGFRVGTQWLHMTPPESYCPPEIAFNEPCEMKSDIWALGCVMFEICYGVQLFEHGEWTPNRDHMFARMVEVLGPFPARWWSSWEARHRWFEDDGTIKIDDWENKPPFPLGYPWHFALVIRESQRGILDERSVASENCTIAPYEEPYSQASSVATPSDNSSNSSQQEPPTPRRKFYPHESAALTDLLGQMLQYNPKERFSADQVCQHRFFERVSPHDDNDAGLINYQRHVL